MRKFLSISVALLMVFVFGCANSQYINIEDAITAKRPPKINTEQKKWLLGLSAVMMEVNKSSHYTLEAEPISEKATSTYKRVLEKWWGINDRYELIAAIKKLENNGHNEVYKKLTNILKSNPKENIESIYYKYNLSRKEVGYYWFLQNNYYASINTNIISWDLGRATSLVRWGYQVGYLTETEAWSVLFYFGSQIKAQYGSWKEYGTSYALGRMFWASGFGKTEEYYKETKETLEALFSENGVWANLEWDFQ